MPNFEVNFLPIMSGAMISELCLESRGVCRELARDLAGSLGVSARVGRVDVSVDVANGSRLNFWGYAKREVPHVSDESGTWQTTRPSRDLPVFTASLDSARYKLRVQIRAGEPSRELPQFVPDF